MRRCMSAPWKPRLLQSLAENKSLPQSRYMQLATVRQDGRPANRTVVFRGFLGESDDLTFVTDKRSHKVAEIAANPAAEVCWYFPTTREQYRLSGNLTVVDSAYPSSDLLQARQHTWSKMSDGGRAQFAWPNPGEARVPGDEAAFKQDRTQTGPASGPQEPALATFCLVVMRVHSVDYVELFNNTRIAVFRHGVRAPFLHNPYYLPESVASNCSLAYRGVELLLRDEVDGGEAPPLRDLERRLLPPDGSCREGWLTPAGYTMALRYGEYLRGKYVSTKGTKRLLSGAFDASQLWAHTTPLHRTANTLVGVVSGMFPSAAKQRRQLTAYAVNFTQEYMYTSGMHCPAAAGLIGLQADLTLAEDARDPVQSAQAASLADELQLEPVDGSQFAADSLSCGHAAARPCYIPLHDKLACMVGNEQPWPRAVTPQQYEAISMQAVRVYGAMTAPGHQRCRLHSPDACYKLLRKGGMGSLVWRLKGNMRRAERGMCGVEGFERTSGCPQARPRLVLFAGHDDTVLQLLTVLSQPPPTSWPWFGSHFEIELWRSESAGGRAFVRVLYNQQVLELLGPGRQAVSLDEFEGVVGPSVATQQEHADACKERRDGGTGEFEEDVSATLQMPEAAALPPPRGGLGQAGGGGAAAPVGGGDGVESDGGGGKGRGMMGQEAEQDLESALLASGGTMECATT